MYQYYNTEPHDYAVNITGGPVTKSEIPAATQLFTTDWVVRYMVDNSLGKYWLERHPNSQLRQSLEYLLPGEIKTIESEEKLEDMRFIDNAMGSGHILVYAFDVFMKMYAEAGYSSRDAALSIVQNNLYGLEIDKRAYQLAYFALMMKARQYNRRALQAGKLKLNVHVFEDTNMVSDEFLNSLTGDYADDVKEVIGLFENARELGSIIRFEKAYDWSKLRQAVESIQSDALDVFGVNQSKKLVLRVLTIAEILTNKYDIAVTNPPYLNKFDADMKKYVKKNYADYSGDLFSIFIFNNINLVKTGGYAGYMTPFVWMFIKTYEKLRNYLVTNKSISSLIQMEYSAFEEATVPINTFVLKNEPADGDGTYIKLSDFKGGMNLQRDKVLEAIGDPGSNYLYRTNQANFGKIPGSPIAYWASHNLIHDFEIGDRMETIVAPKVGLQTGDNKIFLRFWYEVENKNICFDAHTISESVLSEKKWFPYNKGGSYRKWYGNYDYVVNWEHDGEQIRDFTDSNGKIRSRPQNTNYYFWESITWSDITSGDFSARYREPGSIFDVVGKSAFKLDQKTNLLYLLGLLNTKVTNYIFKILNPTIHLQTGNFSYFPVINSKLNVTTQVKSAINTTRTDWDNFENSWNFETHPLLLHIADDNLSIWYYAMVLTNQCAKNVPIFQLWGGKIMVSYQKRGNVWQYEISYKDADGKYKKLRKSGFTRKSDAILAASKIQSEHPNLKTAKAGSETLVSYYERWIKTYKQNAVSPITYNKYQNTAKHARKLFGSLKLKELTKLTYQEKLNEFAKTHARRTVSCLHKQLRACILEAMDEHIIASDPTRKAVITGRSLPKVAKTLNYQDWAKLITHLDTDRIDEMTIYLAAVTGMRYGEIVGLTIHDLDLNKGIINVNKTWDYKYKTGFMKTKTATSNRKVAIDQATIHRLSHYLSHHNSEDDRPILMDNNNHILVSAEINNALTAKLQALSIPRITFHGLRHTHASILLYRGVSVLSVSRRLGHSNITTTQSTYLHIIKELESQDKNKIISILNDTLN